MIHSEEGNPAVTKIVDRIPLPGKAHELEQAIKALITAALRYPGHDSAYSRLTKR